MTLSYAGGGVCLGRKPLRLPFPSQKDSAGSALNGSVMWSNVAWLSSSVSSPVFLAFFGGGRKVEFIKLGLLPSSSLGSTEVCLWRFKPALPAYSLFLSKPWLLKCLRWQCWLREPLDSDDWVWDLVILTEALRLDIHVRRRKIKIPMSRPINIDKQNARMSSSGWRGYWILSIQYQCVTYNLKCILNNWVQCLLKIIHTPIIYFKVVNKTYYWSKFHKKIFQSFYFNISCLIECVTCRFFIIICEMYLQFFKWKLILYLFCMHACLPSKSIFRTN